MSVLRLLLLCIVLAPGALTAQTVTRHELPTGLTVLAAPWSNTHAVDVRVLVEAGPLHAGPVLGAGASRLLERMVRVAARAPKRAAAIQRLGQALRTEVGVAYTSYAIETTDHHYRQALDLLADMLASPPMDEDTLALVRDLQLRMIDRRRKDWRALQDDLINATVYARHPAALPPDGRAPAVADLSLEELAAYHRSRYTSANLIVVVAGNIHPQQVRRDVAEAFVDFPRGNRFQSSPPELPVQYSARTCRRFLPELDGDRHAYVWRTTSLSDPDRLALDLVSVLLAEPGLVDLPKRMRNLCSDFAVEHLCPPGVPGRFAIRYSPGPKSSIEAWQQVQGVLDRLRKDGPDPERLAAAKRQWRRRHLLRNMDVKHQTRELGRWVLEVIEPAYREEQIAGVAEFTPDDIRRVVGRYLHPHGRNRSIVLLKAEEEVLPAGGRTPVSDAPPVVVPFDNGAALLKRQMPALGLAVLRASIGGGSNAETPENLGASWILAGLMARGPENPGAASETERARLFQQQLISTGMEFRTYATRHSIELTLICFPEDVEQALRLLVDTLKHPALPEATYDQLVQDAMHAIATSDQGNDWHQALVNRVRQTLFQDHYASKPVRGTQASLSGLDLQTVRDLHRRLCVGSNLVFSAYGRFDNDMIGNLLAEMLGSEEALPVGDKIAISGRPWPEDLGRRSVQIENGNEATGLAVIYRAPAMEDLQEEGPAMDIITAMLTGSEGQCGRIPTTVDKTLTIRTFGRSYRGRGVWGVLVDAPADGIDPVRQAIEEQITALARELTEAAAGEPTPALRAEVDSARRLCTSHFLLREEDQRATTEAHAQQVLLDQPIEDYLDYPRRLEKVDLEDLAAIAERYLQREILIVQMTPPAETGASGAEKRPRAGVDAP